MPEIAEWLIHGGNIGVILFALYVLYRVNKRLDREESLRMDYPPHRHINGKVIYPKDYEPSAVERLGDA